MPKNSKIQFFKVKSAERDKFVKEVLGKTGIIYQLRFDKTESVG